MMEAVVQSVLLFGSETWTLTPRLLAALEGFQLRAAYRMAKRHKPRRTVTGDWLYPATEDVLEEVGLHSVKEYIDRRRQTIAAWVVSRPIYVRCLGGERRPGTPRHQWWWEQDFDLDEAIRVSESLYE